MQSLRKLIDDAAGSVIQIFAFSLFALVGIAAAAVDGARWYAARHQHAQALDNAILVGASVMQTNASGSEATIAAAEKFYRSNMPASLGTIDNDITFQVDSSGKSVTYSGKAYIEKTLLKTIGIAKLPIMAPSKASYGSGLNDGSNVEIAMMLDVTGSMCADGIGPCSSSAKLDALKTASSDLATTVLGNAQTGYSARVAVIPFAASVRVAPSGGGQALMAGLTGMPATASFSYTVCTAGTAGTATGEIATGGTCTATATVQAVNWQLNPCVTDRGYNGAAPYDASDDAPGSNRWLNGHGGDRRPAGDDSSNTPAVSVNDLGWNYGQSGNGCTVGEGNIVQPLTSNLSEITSRIQALSAYGPTAGALGTNWTQYVLSPKWAPILPESARPAPYGDTQIKQASGAPLLRKIAILMTDGVYNTVRQMQNLTQQQASDAAIAVCRNMKSNGVEVFTIGFDLQSLPVTERAIGSSTLQTCATSSSHYYDAGTANDLLMAFKDISMKVTRVRLTN